MKVLLIGGSGQLGGELRRAAPDTVSLAAPSSSEVSLTDRRQLARAFRAEEPDLVINAAAYTAVDDAETDRETAFSVNAEGARNLALEAAAVGARAIHVSTDFVFGGGQDLPYRPADSPKPLGAYGESKLAGEQAVLESHSASLVVRTSWLYSSGGRNFVKTMLRLFDAGETVRVVADQVGSPTWARTLAIAIWGWAARPSAQGIRHLCDAGIASWYDFAVAIHEEASRLDLIDGGSVQPVRSDQFPTAARRPAWSVLDAFESWKELETEPRHWRASLVDMLGELRESIHDERSHA